MSRTVPQSPNKAYNAQYGTDASDYYGNGIATHGDDLWYYGKHYQQLGHEDLGKVISLLNEYNGPISGQTNAPKGHAQAYAAGIAPFYNQKKAEAAQAEYQRMMAEYMSMMAEAMNREEPAAEPLKGAAEVQSEARADTNRKQLLRRGLMSTMTRYGQGGQAQKLGA